jgi:hypothetical protein
MRLSSIVSLAVQLQYNLAKLYEVVFFDLQSIEELEPPYLTPGSLSGSDRSKTTVSPSDIRAVLSLVDACQGLLRAITHTEVSELKCCPTITFVRSLYAIKVLSILFRALKQAPNPISQIVDEETIRLPHYVGSLIGSLEAAGADGQCRIPLMIAKVAEKIADMDGSLPATMTTRISLSQKSSLGNDSSSRAQVNGMEATGLLGAEPAAVTTGTDETSYLDSPQPPAAQEHTFTIPRPASMDSGAWAGAFESLGASDFEEMLLPFAFQLPSADAFDFSGIDFL